MPRNAWQAARATPADQGAKAHERPLWDAAYKALTSRYKNENNCDASYWSAFNSGIDEAIDAMREMLDVHSATPADQDQPFTLLETCKRLEESNAELCVQLQMTRKAHSDLLKQVLKSATPADHSVPVARAVTALLRRARPRDGISLLTVQDLRTQQRLLDEAMYLLHSAPQPLQNAADHIEAQSVRDAALHALERAKQFIENGVEFGYIRMPTVDDDPANYTLPTIHAAIAALKSAPPQKPEV